MNRNELEDAISRHICKSRYQGSWDDAPSFFKASISRDTKAALSALEAIMERDGLKMLDGCMPTAPINKAAMMQEQQFKDCFDQAKCKLKGGDDV